MFNIFKKKKTSEELLELNEVKACLTLLDNGQIMPLQTIINKRNSLIVRFTDDEQFNYFKNNPQIEIKPFFIEVQKDDFYSFVCYLFVKIHKNKTFTIHEVAFDLTNEIELKECKRILGSEDCSIILLSNNKIHLVDYSISKKITIARNCTINKIVEKSNRTYKYIEFEPIIKLFQIIKENPSDLYDFFIEHSLIESSDILHYDL